MDASTASLFLFSVSILMGLAHGWTTVQSPVTPITALTNHSELQAMKKWHRMCSDDALGSHVVAAGAGG